MTTEITIDGESYDGSPLPSADVVRLTGTFRAVVRCGSATIGRLDCCSAKIGRLWCGSATVDRLECDLAKIGRLDCRKAKIATLRCRSATIGKLDIGSAKINGASTAATPETIRWAQRLVADVEANHLRLNMSRWHGWVKRPKEPAGYCDTTHCIAGAIQCCLGEWRSEPANVLRREAPGLAWLMYTPDAMALRELRRIAALT